MKSYKGSCHCGAIAFTFQGPEIDKGIRCNCSLCKRKGALMSPFTVAFEDIHTTIKDTAMGTYQFGSGIAKHYFCKTCGIYTFHETMRMPGQCRINLGCVDSVNVFELPAAVFDGKAL